MKRAVDKREFGCRVTERRSKLKMSQEVLAEEVGMSQQGIGSIEKGEVARPRLLPELAIALLTTMDWLLYADGPEEALPPNPKEQLRALIDQMDDSEAALMLLRIKRKQEDNPKVA